MSKRRRSRTLSPEEKSLWRTVASSATPRAGQSLEKSLDQSFKEALDLAQELPSSEFSPQDRHFETQNKSVENRVESSPVVTRTRLPDEMRPLRAKLGRAKVPPPLTGLDRKLEQKLARGKVEPETKLDLHGHTRTSAEETLYNFLSNARARGLRCALVVTGKGDTGMSQHTLHGREVYHTPERRTVLREALTQWMHESRFRTLVAGYQPAHPRHGGGGAFYVWLRRIR